LPDVRVSYLKRIAPISLSYRTIMCRAKVIAFRQKSCLLRLFRYRGVVVHLCNQQLRTISRSKAAIRSAQISLALAEHD
jgi:hypothetical protein